MPTTLAPELAGTWTFDPIHSSASFAVKHMVVSTFRGRFEEFDATLVDGTLTGTVNIDSIVVKDENLAAHLRSPEFFDTERFPEIKFVSTDLRQDGNQVVLDGDLTIHGVTQSVEARGEINGPHITLGDAETLGLSLETIIDRTAFGLNWNAPLPKGGFALANDVKLIVELELRKA